MQDNRVYEGNKKPTSDHGNESKTRKCLLCLTPFLSAWAGQRICQNCKSSAAWRKGA